MDVFIVLKGHEFYNEAQTMAQVFYPNRKYIRAKDVNACSITLVSSLENGVCAALVYAGGGFLRSHEVKCVSCERTYLKNAVKISIYKVLEQVVGYTPKWGILTGIRPAKLASAMLADGKNGDEIIEAFKGDYLVSQEKARLALSVAENSRRITKAHDSVENSVNLYAGIPFCPSRCLYCSFTSYPADKFGGLIKSYLDCLRAEIAALPRLPVNSVYIGGGTPTSLNAEQLRYLLSFISDKYDTAGVEYTVEAGRPDTISREKLQIMRKYGVNRLSVNPQTMCAETLKRIGRRHTPEEAALAFKLARDEGFGNVNMDLILGLPGETVHTVKDTFERIAALSPDSITVHTLSVKRASRLNEELEIHTLPQPDEIEEMLKISARYAEAMEMFPYSMYRQKNMLGNFENVGWCKEDKHSIFNIETLEETRTILAAGAGAVTKNVSGDKISRVFNVKNVEEYVKRLSGENGI